MGVTRMPIRCFLCGLWPEESPEKFACWPTSYVAGQLADALLQRVPDLLCSVPNCKTKEDLQAFLESICDEEDPDYFENISEAFRECVAIGYFDFDFDGNAPRKEVDDSMVKYIFHDGRFVEERILSSSDYDDFLGLSWYSDDTREDITPLGWMESPKSYTQGNFGNFYLSQCCLEFLKGWLKRVASPGWGWRNLSFIGQLWEVANSRYNGRKADGCFEWLKPGGEREFGHSYFALELCLNRTYPVKTEAALRSGSSRDAIKMAIYDDYGYWMFVSPHEWPEAPENDDLVEVTELGFNIAPRSTKYPFSLGRFSGLAVELLGQIFCHLPDVTAYLNLKLVCKGMHDLVTDTRFAYPVLREIMRPDPTREMFWMYPLEDQPDEISNFTDCLDSWLSLKCPPAEMESLTARDILIHRKFPLLQFIHALYTNNHTRNRRRLWKNVKQFEEVWSDYQRNGWEVDRFGLPYPYNEDDIETSDSDETSDDG